MFFLRGNTDGMLLSRESLSRSLGQTVNVPFSPQIDCYVSFFIQQKTRKGRKKKAFPLFFKFVTIFLCRKAPLYLSHRQVVFSSSVAMIRLDVCHVLSEYGLVDHLSEAISLFHASESAAPINRQSFEQAIAVFAQFSLVG